jgi:hypothetical protein
VVAASYGVFVTDLVGGRAGLGLADEDVLSVTGTRASLMLTPVMIAVDGIWRGLQRGPSSCPPQAIQLGKLNQLCKRGRFAPPR